MNLCSSFNRQLRVLLLVFTFFFATCSSAFSADDFLIEESLQKGEIADLERDRLLEDGGYINNEPAYVSNRVIVRYKSGIASTSADIVDLLETVGVTEIRTLQQVGVSILNGSSVIFVGNHS